jgi:hypothetical protein
MKDLSDTNPGYGDRERLEDRIRLIDKKEYTKKYRSYRYVGGVTSFVEVWMPIFKDGKPLIGKTKKQVKIPMMVTNYNPDTEKHDPDVTCPFLELAEKMNPSLGKDDQIKPKRIYLGNVIDRVAQDARPRNAKEPTKKELKTGFITMDSHTFTPVGVLPTSSGTMRKVKNLNQLNVRKNKKTGEKQAYSVAHPVFGIDVNLKFDPDEKGSAMYDVQRGDNSKLTDEEKAYLIWDIEKAVVVMTREEAQIEADRIWAGFKGNKSKSSKNEDDDEMPDDIEDEDYVSDKKKKNKKRPVDDDDDEDDDDEDDDKPAKKKKKKPVDDDDDDDDDDADDLEDIDADDDDDDDEAPAKKKKGGKKTSKSSKDEDDEDDEDEKPAKKKKKPVDDDDDDDEPPFKGGKKVKVGKKKPVDDDDDLDDDLDDLDADDDEDEKPAKKKKGGKAKPVKKKKKPVDDDDDDDDD